jgi:hypothetical protein
VTVTSSTKAIAVQVWNQGGAGGWRGYFSDGTVVNATTWKCTTTHFSLAGHRLTMLLAADGAHRHKEFVDYVSVGQIPQITCILQLVDVDRLDFHLLRKT